MAELSGVTAGGHHMFAQVGLCGNVMLKDEAQRMKFACEVSVNFLTAVYPGRTKRPKLNSDVKFLLYLYPGEEQRVTSLLGKFLNLQLEGRLL